MILHKTVIRPLIAPINWMVNCSMLEICGFIDYKPKRWCFFGSGAGTALVSSVDCGSPEPRPAPEKSVPPVGLPSSTDAPE
jgi:hypothetical protein